MPHKCVKCGKEYPDSSEEILKGCGNCGSRKFLYTRAGRKPARKREEIPAIPKTEERKEVEPAVEESEPVDIFNCVESIRIISPGTYELNIQKLAQSDDRVVGYGSEGSYGVDLLSMMKPKKKKTEKRND